MALIFPLSETWWLPTRAAIPAIARPARPAQLQRRSTYLIIHLAIVDLLVGGVSGPMFITVKMISCGQWRYHPSISVGTLFPFTSVMNLAAISLERLHVTFRPIQHHFLSNWHYGVIIFVMWFISVVTSSIPVVFYGLLKWSLELIMYYYYILYSIYFFFILVILSSLTFWIECNVSIWRKYRGI